MDELSRLRMAELQEEEEEDTGSMLERAVEQAELAAKAEGDRVGAEVERQSDFMTVLLENCGGEVFLVEMAMTAANKAADRVQLEMGGEAMQSKRPGKMLLSATNGKVVVCCHVPEAHHTVHATAEEWMQSVLAVSSATQVLRSDMDFALAIIKADDGTSSFQVGGKSFSKGEAAAHEVTRVSVEFLRGKGLFPGKPDEDDDYIPEW